MRQAEATSSPYLSLNYHPSGSKATKNLNLFEKILLMSNSKGNKGKLVHLVKFSIKCMGIWQNQWESFDMMFPIHGTWNIYDETPYLVSHGQTTNFFSVWRLSIRDYKRLRGLWSLIDKRHTEKKIAVWPRETTPYQGSTLKGGGES